MVGVRWATQAPLLAAFVVVANGMLRGGESPLCPNSDGLAGYSFSHKGLWIPGYKLLGTGFTKQGCSAKCSDRADCVAFSGAFKEDGGNGACYTYAATGGNVPSGGDRAYKKCKVQKLSGVPAHKLSGVPAAVHLVAQAVQAPPDPALGLMKQAEAMEKQLDQVSATLLKADQRMRRLKGMVAGASNVLTAAGRIASASSKIALANRGGLQAIVRQKDMINRTFAAINTSSVRIDKLMKKIKARKPAQTKSAPGAPKKEAGAALADLAPNVTSIEKTLNQLNDPATAKQINGLSTSYDGFKSKITATVQTVLFSNIRGLVDNMRGAYHNYTDALTNRKKDPCCCKEVKLL